MGSCLVDIVVGWWVLESTTQQCACGCQSCTVHLEIIRRVNYVLSSGRGGGCGVPQFFKKKEKNFIFPLLTVHSSIYPTPSKISDVRHQ